MVRISKVVLFAAGLGIALLTTGAREVCAETLMATFTQPDGGVTVNTYDELVQLHVTCMCQSYANVYNDAFYLFTNQFSTIQHGWDGGFYQLAFGTSPLPIFDVGNNVERFLVGTLPAYNAAHDYTFVLITTLVSPGLLHSGVGDAGVRETAGHCNR